MYSKEQPPRDEVAGALKADGGAFSTIGVGVGVGKNA